MLPYPSKLKSMMRMAVAGVALGLVVMLVLLWDGLPRRWRGLRRRLVSLAWRVLLWGFGVDVIRHGTPRDARETIFIANHVSWIDIAGLGLLVDAGFVAKAEVGNWPGIGRMARNYPCLFLDRARRLAAGGQAQAMADHAGDCGLILFPEGTTSNGSAVLPFRSSLFAAASSPRWQQIQPVTITFRAADGAALTPALRRKIAWLDDDELLPHAFALAAAGGAQMHVYFETAIPPGERKALAGQCHAIIQARLADSAG